MTVRLHVLDAYDEIPHSLREMLRTAFDKTLPEILKLLPIDQVDVLASYSKRVIPEYGVNGYAFGKGRIDLALDLENPHCNDLQMPTRIGSILGHELHHVARIRSTGYPVALGEALVSEGLAQVFEEEIGFPTPFYAVNLSPGELAAFEERAKPLAHAEDYDYAAWLFGRHGDLVFPRQCGYSLGYALVKRYLKLTSSTAAQSVAVPASEIVEPWLEGVLQV